MSFWTAVGIIVIVGAIASVLKARYNAQHGITEDMMGNQTLNVREDRNEAAEAAQAEVAELKERIKVLERIATDANSAGAQERARISAEIESLRTPDQTPASPTPANKEDLSE